MIKGKPCKVVSISVSKTGKHGHAKCNFTATDIWQTASPEDPVGTGWIGRFHDCAVSDQGRAFKGISFSNSLPGVFKSERSPAPAVRDLSEFRFFPKDADAQRADDLQAFLALQHGEEAGAPRAAAMQAQVLAAAAASDQVQRLDGGYRSRVRYPNSGLASQLRQIARLIASPLGVKTYHASIGGFDTHANQPRGHGEILGALAAAVSAFLADMEEQKRADHVVVLTYSEFGRRVRENGSVGTDHGAASCLFVAGAPIKGGIVGAHPGLEDEQLDHGDLQWHTDFRRVYAAVLERWLGCRSDAVLGRRFDPLPLFG